MEDFEFREVEAYALDTLRALSSLQTFALVTSANGTTQLASTDDQKIRLMNDELDATAKRLCQAVLILQVSPGRHLLQPRPDGFSLNVLVSLIYGFRNLLEKLVSLLGFDNSVEYCASIAEGVGVLSRSIRSVHGELRRNVGLTLPADPSVARKNEILLAHLVVTPLRDLLRRVPDIEELDPLPWDQRRRLLDEERSRVPKNQYAQQFRQKVLLPSDCLQSLHMLYDAAVASEYVAVTCTSQAADEDNAVILANQRLQRDIDSVIDLTPERLTYELGKLEEARYRFGRTMTTVLPSCTSRPHTMTTPAHVSRSKTNDLTDPRGCRLVNRAADIENVRRDIDTTPAVHHRPPIFRASHEGVNVTCDDQMSRPPCHDLHHSVQVDVPLGTTNLRGTSGELSLQSLCTRIIDDMRIPLIVARQILSSNSKFDTGVLFVALTDNLDAGGSLIEDTIVGERSSKIMEDQNQTARSAGERRPDGLNLGTIFQKLRSAYLSESECVDFVQRR